MKPRMKTLVLAGVLAGWASGAMAQDNCMEKINAIKIVADIQAALTCVQGNIAAEAARSRKQAENDKQALQQVADHVELVTTKVRHMSLKEATNGDWKQIPESAEANACFLSSVRLPPQGLCQVTHQGTLDRWAYNVSDIAGAGFTCTATCVWLGVRRKAQAQPPQ